MQRLKTLIKVRAAPRYIIPLFWQKGAPRDALLEEIRQMDEGGAGGFILESRPFKEFLADAWWETVEFILAEAERRNMQVFVFDDIIFPSGFAAGKVRDEHPEYLKIYLRENHVDAVGPLPGASFLVGSWAQADEQLVRVVAARRTDGRDGFDATTVCDLTAGIRDGILYWGVPPGPWRVFMFVRTRKGGEEHTKDYINPLEPEAVRLYIAAVYDPHYAHFGRHFGKTFAGFFSDEPRFGNAASYVARIGHLPMVLPYRDRLLDDLREAWGGDFSALLPCLWYDGGDITGAARFTYMDVVSRLYGRHFTQQIGDWCRGHGVKLIGHVVEDNGAHARLGYGAGHFFRAIHGQDWSGVDVVSQVWPEHTSGTMASPFGILDMDFFHWGMVKMASSAGHLDPGKNGTTACEAFGAYGWQEGLKLMKWLTDYLCVRGINRLIPHAFSPQEFPDPDCPPHFYARGHNPQWRYFRLWSDYANRLCHLLSGGQHAAPAAVVYHAEAEWAGAYEPFEKAVRALAERQIDCDVIPVDTFLDGNLTSAQSGSVRIHKEEYRAIVVPFAERLPAPFMEKLAEFARAGVRIVFLREWPVAASRPEMRFAKIMKELRDNPNVVLLQIERLADDLIARGIGDLRLSTPAPTLRHYCYVHADGELYFFVNESTVAEVDTAVTFSRTGTPVAYDAMTNSLYELVCRRRGDGVEADLCLEPNESIFIVFGDRVGGTTKALPLKPLRKQMTGACFVEGPWSVAIATVEEYPCFTSAPMVTGLGNVAVPGVLPAFSGTMRYATDFHRPDAAFAGRVFLDLGKAYEIAEVVLNGKAVGTRIAPPYRFEVTAEIRPGLNQLRIDVTNTLAKQVHDNVFDRAMPQEPSGLIGPVQVLEEMPGSAGALRPGKQNVE